VVTHPSTSLTITSLSMGERTGSRVLWYLWSYVKAQRVEAPYHPSSSTPYVGWSTGRSEVGGVGWALHIDINRNNTRFTTCLSCDITLRMPVSMSRKSRPQQLFYGGYKGKTEHTDG
jgi:hypothetical protein